MAIEKKCEKCGLSITEEHIRYTERVVETPRYVEKTFDLPVLKPKEVEFEKPVLVEKEYEKPVIREKEYEKPVLVPKTYIVPIIERNESLVAVRVEDFERMKEISDVILPKILKMLETIVRFEPKVKEVEVETQVVKKVVVEVLDPKLVPVQIEKPYYVDVSYERPVIREQVYHVKKLVVKGKDGKPDETVGFARE